jgi:CDP-glucose 4,6-dehydratase
MNVLEAARATPSLRSLVYVTSDKCYKNKEWVWGYRENDELGGGDPYSVSKAAAELVFSSYRDAFLSESAPFRNGQCEGGERDWGGRLVLRSNRPDCVRALQKNRPIVLRYPQATRPWQHVLDPLYGYLLLATRLFASPERFQRFLEFWPSGGIVAMRKDLADTIVRFWGKGQIRVAPVNPQFARSFVSLLEL